MAIMILALSNVPIFVHYHEKVRHGAPGCVAPFDLIEAAIETHEGTSVQVFENGKPFYEATGTTNVNWDSSTTIGVRCEVCGDTGLVPEWARECEPLAEMVGWLANNVRDELAGWS